MALQSRPTSSDSKLINVLLIISFENSLFVFDLCYNRILILTKVMISHAKTPSGKKGAAK